MWNLISSILTIIGKIFGVISSTDIAKYNAEATVGVAVAEEQSAVQQKWWFVAIVPVLLTAPYILWSWKAIAWDKVIGPILEFHSRTDPITGPLGWAYVIIISYWFINALVIK